MGWTPETIKELKRLWNKGFTTVEIGNRLGMSKNAIVGKAHRLGLESRPSPIKRELTKVQIQKPKAKPLPEVKVKVEPVVDLKPLGADFAPVSKGSIQDEVRSRLQ